MVAPLRSRGRSLDLLRKQSELRNAKTGGSYIPIVPYDTGNKAQIVRGLVELCSEYLTSMWPEYSGTGQAHYRLPLKSFVHEVLRRSRSSYPVFQVALYYITRLKPVISSGRANSTLPPTLQCSRRVFVATLMIASKYLNDRNFRMSGWSKISGLPPADLCRVELATLSALDWNLHVSGEIYEQCCAKLQRFLASPPLRSDRSEPCVSSKPFTAALSLPSTTDSLLVSSGADIAPLTPESSPANVHIVEYESK